MKDVVLSRVRHAAQGYLTIPLTSRRRTNTISSLFLEGDQRAQSAKSRGSGRRNDYHESALPASVHSVQPGSGQRAQPDSRTGPWHPLHASGWASDGAPATLSAGKGSWGSGPHNYSRDSCHALPHGGASRGLPDRRHHPGLPARGRCPSQRRDQISGPA